MEHYWVFRAGFVKVDEDGTATATTAVTSAETQRQLREAADTRASLLAGPGTAFDSSTVLVWECMQALPKILTGK